MVAEVVGGEKAGGFLPQVSTSSAAEGPPCTYYREQRSHGRYDLFATAFPRKRDAPSTPRRLPVGGLDKHVKCTVLPALASIDPLLSSPPEAGEVRGREGRGNRRASMTQGAYEDSDLEEQGDSFLPAMEARRSLAEQEQGLSRIYPGRCASTTMGSNQMPVPTDDEFRGWLTPLPPRDGTLSRQELMSPGRQHLDRCFPASSSSLSMSNVSEDCDGGISAWLIMLMRSTYENPKHTPQRVAIGLADLLGLTMQEAEHKARDAQVRLFAVLQRFEDRRECFSKLRGLRRVGFVVQVVTEASVPHAGHSVSGELADGRGDGGPRRPKKGATTARNYGEVFRRSMHGADSSFLPRLPPSARAKPRRAGTGRWKGEGAEVAIQVLPEDPVEAFFSAEDDRIQKAMEQERATRESLLVHRPHRKTEPPSESSVLPAFSSLVWRHRSTLKKTADVVASQVSQTFDEQDKPGSPQSNSDPSKDGPDKAAANGNSTFWEVVLDAVVPKTKIPPARKEACQMMRFFVYGRIGNETARTGRESEKVFYEAIGTKDEVFLLFKMWQQLDQDHSGRVDIVEFRMFAEQNMREKLEALLTRPVTTPKHKLRRNTRAAVPPPPAWSRITSAEEIPEFVSRLCSKLGQLLLGKKSSFIMEDMMRLVWPCAQQKDLKVMRSWCKDFVASADMRRAKTPPLLPQADYQGLCSVFDYFDEDRNGTIRLEELVSKGLIYEEQAPAYFRQWDRNGDGLLDLLEFCEMMCPIGYRAHRDCESGSSPDGTRVVFDRQLKIWRTWDRAEEVLATLDH